MRQLSNAAAFLIVCVILVLPWCFGGVFESSYLLLAGTTAIALVLFLIGEFASKRTWPVMPVFAWLLIIAGFYGAIQSVPFPDSMIRLIAPGVHQLRGEAAEAFGGNGSELPTACLSLAPSETWPDVAKLLLAAAIAGIVICSTATIRYRSIMMRMIAVNGCCLAIFGVAQMLTWNGKLYWIVDSPNLSSFAAYANRNNAGGYLLMVFFVFLGLRSTRGMSEVGRSANINWRSRWSDLVHADRHQVSFWLGAVVLLLAIVLTLSRGTFLGLVVGGIAYMAVRYVTIGKRPTIEFVGLLVVVGLLLAWCRFDERVWSRLTSITDPTQFATIRFRHWHDDLTMLRDFWTTGCGIGNYSIANRTYQTIHPGRWFLYSENLFLETALVAGVPGVLLVVTLFARLTRAVRELVAGTEENLALAAAAAGVMGSQATAAVFDFGLYLSANFSLMTFCCGLFIASSRRGRGRTGEAQVAAKWYDVAGWLLLLCGVAASIPLFWGRSLVEREVRDHRKLTQSSAVQHRLPTQIDDQIARLENGLRLVPGSWTGEQLLAELWIERNRVQLFQSLSLESDVRREGVWVAASLPFLLARMGQLQPDQGAVEEIRNNEIVRANLPLALEASRRSVRDCPFVGKTAYQTALLEAVLGEQRTDLVSLLRHANRWSPQSSTLHFQTASLALTGGNREEGIAWFTRSLGLNTSRSSQHLEFAAAFVTPDEFASSVVELPPDEWLRILSPESHNADAQPLEAPLRIQVYADSVVQRLLTKIEALPDSRFVKGQKAFIQFSCEAKLGNVEQAAKHLKLAVAESPNKVNWRYRLARTLADQGDVDAALRHARHCQSLIPTDQRFERLIARLTRQRKSSAIKKNRLGN